MTAKPDTEVVLIDELSIAGDGDSDGVIAMVTINRPDKLNALNSDVVSGLKQMCVWAESTERVRIVVIRGAAPKQPAEGERAKPVSFVAGADINEFVGKGSSEIKVSFKDNAWEAIWNLSKPTIAMVDGFALGGGLEVACSCDIRIASQRSKFATPEINLGLIPGGGGTQRLSRLIGFGNTMEMVMSGEMIDAEQAHRIGLVNQVHPNEELEEKTLALARNIGGKSPHTLKVAKRVVRNALEKPLSEGVAIEAEEFAGLFDSKDKEIGVKAFLSKKQPKWLGR